MHRSVTPILLAVPITESCQARCPCPRVIASDTVTHVVQFSATSPKLSSTSRLVATLAKPWGTSSHSSKRTPVPSE